MARPSKGTRLEQYNGIFYIVWSEPVVGVDGKKTSRTKRRSTGTGNRQEAEETLAGFILHKDKQAEPGDTPLSFILADYWDEHGQHLHSKERTGIAIRHLGDFFGSTPVSGLSRKKTDEYGAARRAGRIGRRASDGTLRRELGILVAAMNHAVREGRLAVKDVPYVHLPSEPAAKDRWLTENEANELREACGGNARIRLFIEIGLATGARKRAIEDLTWFQVDIKRGIIDFNPPGRVQTKKRRPRVPISNELMPFIEAAKREAKNEYVLGERGSVRTAFTAAVRRAGLKKVTPHTLRHTLATWMAQAGRSFYEIGAVLGDTPSTVERKYSHHSPSYLRNAVNFRKETGHENEHHRQAQEKD